MMTGKLGVATIAASLLGLASATAGQSSDPLASHQWRSRVLLVIASDAHDAKLVRQRTIFHDMGSGARDRDLTLIEAIGTTPQAEALRKRFDVAEGGFHAILIGKDGGDKLTSDEPLGADKLFPLIDAMPMRQQEMRGRS